jgi:hypothetical protein
MKAKLQASGLPYKEVECYGAQIVVTCWSRGAADRWTLLLDRFARVTSVVQSVDYAKKNRGTCLLPTTVDVWRVFARVDRVERVSPDAP